MPAVSSPRARSAEPRPSRSAAPRAVRRPSGRTAPGARVRWDRVGRLAMLCVLGALLYLYLSAGVHMFSSWRQSSHDKAAVVALEHEHVALVQQHQTLAKQSTLEAQARQLGMIKKGEQPYIVNGLPRN
jgi:cell division protein FtsB